MTCPTVAPCRSPLRPPPLSPLPAPTLSQPLERIVDRLSRAWGTVSHLKAVKDTPELRAAVEEVQPERVKLSLRLSQARLAALCRCASVLAAGSVPAGLPSFLAWPHKQPTLSLTCHPCNRATNHSSRASRSTRRSAPSRRAPAGPPSPRRSSASSRASCATSCWAAWRSR